MGRLISVILLSMFLQLAYGQADKGLIYPVNNRSYSYEGDTLAFKEMSHVFSTNMEYAKRYKRSLNALMAGKILGWTSATALVGGVVLLVIPQGNSFECDGWGCISTGQAIGIVSTFLVTPFTGTSGLISHFIGKSNKKELINDYNLEINELGKVRQIPALNLGSLSGIGLTLSF